MDILQAIDDLGLKVVREEGAEYALYCPFHDNHTTPALYVNKLSGLWHCFNPSCGEKGTIKTLYSKLGVPFGETFLPDEQDVDDALENLMKEEGRVEENWNEALEKITVDYDNVEEVKSKLGYLMDRGFSVSALRQFDVAYSDAKGRIVIPCRDANYKVVGFIGRATDPDTLPKYLYSKHFPRKSVLFNLQNAKHYPSVVVVEGSLDAIRVHQGGLPNVVATLGSSVTDDHIKMLKSYFDEIIVFGDNDEAGFAMNNRIANECATKRVKVVVYGDSPHTDPGSIPPEEMADFVESHSVDYLDYLYSTFE